MRRTALAAALVFAFVAARHRPAVQPPPLTNGPTFSKEVVRIFQDHCQTCHHPGDIGPISLMDYAGAYPNRLQIKLMTKTHQMPPWKPTAACGDFADERVLSQDEIDTITKWVDAGAPEGSPADMPKALEFGGGWAPGARPTTLPDGVALSLPASSRVVLQVHYHPHHGAPGPDNTRIGIYFAKKKPTKLLRILPLINQSFTIPPNDSNYRVTAG